MFLSSFSEILKKSKEYFVQIFKHSDGNFASTFEKTCEKLPEKHEII